MRIMKYSKVLKRDIDEIIADRMLFDPLKGASILVTGATGLIGSMLVRTLHAADLKYDLGIGTKALVRNEDKARSIFGDMLKVGRTELCSNSYGVFTHIIHAASPTASRYFVEHPVETIRYSVNSTSEILEAARKDCAKVVYISSMEEYGIPYVAGETMTEDRIGIIDHLNVRSCYPESKRLCECLCASYALEYGVDVKIARLAQTYGAGAPLTDNRMPMQFARAAASGTDIELHTEGRSLINSVYLADAVKGILTILNDGNAGEAYNICNDDNTRSVRDIAELISSEVCGGGIAIRVVIPEGQTGFAPDSSMYLSSQKLKALGWKPVVDLAEGYKRLTEFIRECEGSNGIR